MDPEAICILDTLDDISQGEMRNGVSAAARPAASHADL